VNDHLAEAFFKKKGDKLNKLEDRTSVKIQYSCNFNPEYVSLPTENVLGYIEGTDKKDEVIVIGAHYDHIGVTGKGINYGADDNASGTAALIELVKAFAEAKKQGFLPRRTILFIAFTGEEEGLFGSKFYVTHPWFAIDKTIAMLNMDMIGRCNKKNPDPCYYSFVKACGYDKRYMKHQVKKVNRKNGKIKLDFHPGLLQRLGFSFGSDHYNFKKCGVPTTVFTTGFLHHDYHTPKDTPDKIKPKTSAIIAQLVYLFAWELANKD
jgi:Zn-dependent M28 family amino/carboxypeptidase